MLIYMTRHGETEWNKAGRMQGWKNSNLTEKGIRNARKLGEKLMDIQFDKIYCSPAGRARETAEHILCGRKIDLEIKEDLKEMGFGVWEGMEFEVVREKYADQHHKLWKSPHHYEPVEGETFGEVFTRVRQVLKEIVEDGKETVLIVTHAAILKTIYAIVKGYSLEHFWSEPFMYDTNLSILEYKDGAFSFILEADTSHLMT